MARNKSGAFNRLLNFIGLVDDGDSRDTYGEEYQNGNYGRQAAYTPNRQPRSATDGRTASGGRTASTRQPQRRSLPEARQSRFDDRSSTRASYSDRNGYDDYASSSRRTASRFDDGDYDDYGSAGSSRSASRFAEQPERRPVSNPPQTRQPARMRVSSRSRTVMYSLHSLEDCCEVIDQLIANNTVVLTMDELDGRLMQRAVDTLSGAVFALHASIRKASDRTYLVAPMSVEVNDAYDVERGFR